MIRRIVVSVVAVVAGSVVATATVWSIFEAQPRAVETIPVVLANLDEPVTIGEGDSETTVAAGRLLAAELTRGADSSIDWTIVGPESVGVAEDFAIVVTIPEEFSATVAGVLESEPGQGTVTIEADPDVSVVASRVASTVSEAAVTVFNDDIAATYIESVFVTNEAIAEGAGESAEGAASLSEAARDLAQGQAEFAEEVDSFAQGAESSSSATDNYVASVGTLADGVASTATGASGLSSRLSQLDTAANTALTGATGTVASNAEALAMQLAALASSCDVVAQPTYCASVASAALDAAQLAGSSGLADATADEVAAGVSASAAGASDLARSTALLSGAAQDLADGGEQIAGASAALSSGADGLNTAAAALSDGQSELSEGSSELEDGLVALEDAIPLVDELDRETLAQSLATSSAVLRNGAPVASDAIGAIAAALALWGACLIVFARRRAVPPWASAADARPLRATVLGFVPPALLTVCGATSIWITLIVVGVLDAPWAALGLLLLGALTLTAVGQSIVALAGRHSAWIFMLLAIVQVAAASLVLPPESGPSALREAGSALPLAVLMTSLRDAAAGVAVNPQSAWGLVAWTIVALATTMMVTSITLRRRHVT